MSKYSNLPDIDRGVDVFETPDEVEEPLKPSEELLAEEDTPAQPSTSEAIDGSKLPNRKKAERVFGRGARRKDGALQYRLRPRSGSGSSGSEGEELRESPTARLSRLKRELAELESEVRANAEAGPSQPAPKEKEKKIPTRKSVIPPKEPIDLMGEIGGLRDRIGVMEVNEESEPWRLEGEGAGWKERIAELGKPGSLARGHPNGATAAAGAEDTGLAEGDPKATQTATGVGELDKRLAALEELIGPLGEGSDQSSAPLLDTVSKLDHLLLVLTQPRHLDAISRRIKLLLVDLDRAATAARRAPAGSSSTQPPATSVTLSAQEYNSLQSLFAILPRLDPLLPIVPPLLARLKSLAALHAQAGGVADTLKLLEKDDQRSTEEVRDLGKLVEEVKKGIEDGAGGISRNWEALNGRLQSLEERIKKL